ncbi:MAG: asparagine synthase (glutamine-hydrolyzing) [Gammaproteobacteria bacterium]
MCGLAGLVTLSGSGDPSGEEALVRRMCDVIAYRGPDDSGIKRVGSAVLGSRRLAIIDLSQAGHMPMSDATGRWWIAYNGEVFNFAEIREELLKLGHEFHSKTDTEVILHSWMQWGSECMHKFVGMFAFAVADTNSGDVVLVRDRYGIKPLYHTRQGDTILFASEMKALVQEIPAPRVDQQSLSEWMLYRSVDSLTPQTLIEGVHAVLPGHVVTIDAQGVHSKPWYSPLNFVSQAEYKRLDSMPPEAVVKEFDQTLDDAVRLRLISDVPVGTLLSGGLDSSLVTAMAARHTDKLSAFHVSIEGFPELDERKYAEHLTDRLKIPFIPLSLTGTTFRRALTTCVYLSDLPLSYPNTIAYYLICKLARDNGVIVLLSGEGADELFGGYSWNYRRKMRMMRLQKWMNLLPDKLHDIAALLVYSNAGLPVSTRRFREALAPAVDFLDRHARLDWLEQCEETYGFVSDKPERAVLGAMLADLSDFLTPLLRRLDRASMGASVECRVPLLDHRLVHKAINLPLEYKVGARADKWVLKEVAKKYIPDRLIGRKKAGFPLPVGEYIAPLVNMQLFRNGFCQESLGLSERALRRLMESGHRRTFGFFGLVTLEIWGRIHIRREPLEQVSALVESLERPAR